MKKSFTLIELLIVLVIIGIAAALAIPKYLDYAEKTKAIEAINMITALRSAEELYHSENGDYTDNTSLLDLKNVPSDNTEAVAKGQCWYYTISILKMDIHSLDPDQNRTVITMSFLANRSTNRGGATNLFIVLMRDLGTGKIQWSGNHPGTPKNE